MKNILDLVIVSVGILGFLQGYRKGLLEAVSKLGSFSLASMLTVKFSPYVAKFVEGYMEIDNKTDYGLMQIIVSILTLVLSRQLIIYLTSILTNTLEAIKLGFLNRILGGSFGFVNSLFFSIVVVVILDHINPFIGLIPRDIFEKSNLYTPMRAGLFRFILPAL